MIENNPHKRVTEGQLRKQHADEIRDSIATLVDLLEKFGREHYFQAYAPDLSVNPTDHTALMSWGIDTDVQTAIDLTLKFNEQYGDQLPRLKVMLLGNVNL
jgi:hypothetical protein